MISFYWIRHFIYFNGCFILRSLMIPDVIDGLSLNWLSCVPRKYRIVFFFYENAIKIEYCGNIRRPRYFFIALYIFLTYKTWIAFFLSPYTLTYTIRMANRVVFRTRWFTTSLSVLKKTLIFRHWTSHSHIAYTTIFVYLCPSPISLVYH